MTNIVQEHDYQECTIQLSRQRPVTFTSGGPLEVQIIGVDHIGDGDISLDLDTVQGSPRLTVYEARQLGRRLLAVADEAMLEAQWLEDQRIA